MATFKICEGLMILVSQFRLPGKKELWATSSSEELVVMDVMEVKLKDLKNGKNNFIEPIWDLRERRKMDEITRRRDLPENRADAPIPFCVTGKPSLPRNLQGLTV